MVVLPSIVGGLLIFRWSIYADSPLIIGAMKGNTWVVTDLTKWSDKIVLYDHSWMIKRQLITEEYWLKVFIACSLMICTKRPYLHNYPPFFWIDYCQSVMDIFFWTLRNYLLSGRVNILQPGSSAGLLVVPLVQWHSTTTSNHIIASTTETSWLD